MKYKSFSELRDDLKFLLKKFASKFKSDLKAQTEIVNTIPENTLELIDKFEPKCLGDDEDLTDIKLLMAKYHNKRYYHKLKLNTDLGPGIEQPFPLKKENESVHTSQLDDFYKFEDFEIVSNELKAIFKISKAHYLKVKKINISNLRDIVEYIYNNKKYFEDYWLIIHDKLVSIYIFMAIFHNKNKI